MRLTKPVYESLPWLHAAGGALALGAGYRLRPGVLSTLLSVGGLIWIIAGVAIWLRRRDYRAGRRDYARGDDD